MPVILIVNNAEPGIRDFTLPLEKIVLETGFEYKTIEYKMCLQITFEKFDGVIMSGSPQGDDIVEHHAPYFRWIKTIEKPVLGICAGHHITGFIYGSEIL